MEYWFFPLLIEALFHLIALLADSVDPLREFPPQPLQYWKKFDEGVKVGLRGASFLVVYGTTAIFLEFDWPTKVVEPIQLLSIT